MAVKPISINIDTVTDSTVEVYNNIVKGDTLSITFKIFQNSSSLNLTGQTMHIVLQKADGYSVEKIISSVTGNTFTVNFDVQATLAVGEVEGIIEISDLNGTDISNVFNFEVKQNPSSNVVIKSSDQIETLSQIVGLINSYNANATNLALQNDLAVQHEANLTTINNTSSGLITTLETDIATGQALDIELKSDITIGTALDITLKNDIANGINVDNGLKISITNGNEVIAQLANADWAKIQSFMDLMEIMLNGTPLTDENDIELTDEFDVVLTI